MYQVVEFKSTNDDGAGGGGVGVISRLWLSPNKTNCRWPNTKRPIDKKILHLEPETTWKTYGVNRIFYASDDLLKARDRARRAEIESEFSANSNEGSPKIRKRQSVARSKHHQNSSSDEENSHSDIVFPLTPPFLRTIASPSSFQSSSLSSGSKSVINDHDSAEITAKSLHTSPALPSSDSLDRTLIPTNQASGPLDVISRHLARIENGLKELQLAQNEILARLRSAQTNTPASTLPDEIIIPCNDLQSLQVLERALLTAENGKLLENYLSFVGGHKTSAIIRRILEKVFTNELALICNWTGKNNKNALKNLNVINVIKGAVRRHKISELATDAEINTCISNWFRFTKDRDGGREKRRPGNTTSLEKN